MAGRQVGAIQAGLCALVGVAEGDSGPDAEALARRAVGLRVFEDEAGRMNLSVAETGGQMLVVSQFTLIADTRKGRRPSFTQAATPADARQLYEYAAARFRRAGLKVATGRFQEHMLVDIANDGRIRGKGRAARRRTEQGARGYPDGPRNRRHRLRLRHLRDCGDN